jgi:hypothetical protein
MNYTAYITGPTGISKSYALIAFEREDALEEARLLGASMFNRFTYSVRQQ